MPIRGTSKMRGMVMQYSTVAGIDLDEASTDSRQSVIVIDDEADTVYLLKLLLRNAGFNVMSAACGEDALRKILEHQPDLVLLDIMMPVMDGWEFYRYLKQVAEVPVIIISALGTKECIIKGLHNGADDYIVKPFDNSEVVERIHAVLRRSGKKHTSGRLIFPGIGLVIDTASQEVSIRGQPIGLSPKEYSILKILALNAPSIVRYETIATTLWDRDSREVRNRTKYLVYLLRRKLEKVNPSRQLILNLDRRGYKLQTEV
jgi:DNA-binding response OmpR family regulator